LQGQKLLLQPCTCKTLQTYIARAAGTHTSIIDRMSLSQQQQRTACDPVLLQALQMLKTNQKAPG